MIKIKFDFFTLGAFLLSLVFYLASILLDITIFSLMGKYLFVIFVGIIFLAKLEVIQPSKKDLRLFTPFIMFILIYLINLVQSVQTNGIMMVINLTAYLLIIYMVYKISWDSNHIKTLSYVFYVCLPILYLLTFVATDLLNTNTIGSYAFFLSFFPLLHLVNRPMINRKTQYGLILSLTLVVVLGTSTRSIVLSGGFGFLTYLLWGFISKRKSLFKGYFISIGTMIYGITVIYPSLHRLPNFEYFNNLSLELTGKRIMSGRNTIWAQIIDLIESRPFFGYGSSILPEDFLTTSLSAHNLFLQIGLQIGIIGLFFLILFFYRTWDSFWDRRKDPKVMLSAIFFISILVHQTFEVTLTQNQFGLGLVQWLIIAFGLNYSKRRNINGRESI